jgi:hypothetical protein
MPWGTVAPGGHRASFKTTPAQDPVFRGPTVHWACGRRRPADGRHSYGWAMGMQGYAGFDETTRGLTVVVPRRPWRLRFPGPVRDVLAELAELARPDSRPRRRKNHRSSDSPEAQELRHDSLVFLVALGAGTTALCLLPLVVELVLWLAAWPVWLLARCLPQVPRTVEVRQGHRVVHSVRARDRAHADELCERLRSRVSRGEALDPDPTDFSDLLVRPRRRRS